MRAYKISTKKTRPALCAPLEPHESLGYVCGCVCVRARRTNRKKSENRIMSDIKRVNFAPSC